jgi:hypothetical protein
MYHANTKTVSASSRSVILIDEPTLAGCPRKWDHLNDEVEYPHALLYHNLVDSLCRRSVPWTPPSPVHCSISRRDLHQPGFSMIIHQ